jgi:hypothetical protein
MTTATATCASCELDLEHCHADLVEHDDGSTTCLDGCRGPLAVHDLVIRCAEVGMGCCGEATVEPDVPVLPEEPAWAA